MSTTQGPPAHTPTLGLWAEAQAEFVDKLYKSGKVKEGDTDSNKQLQTYISSGATPKDAQAAGKLIQIGAGKRFGAKKIGDKVVIKQQWIDNIMGNIGNAIELGNKVMAGAPEMVSAAWFVVKIGLGAIQENYALYSLFGSGLTSTTEIMILVPHYDKIYDQRDSPGFKMDDMAQELFRQIKECYVAVMDFTFSVKKHIEASTARKVGNFFKDSFGTELKKFQAKSSTIMELKAKIVQSSKAVFEGRMLGDMGDVKKSLDDTLDKINDFSADAALLAEGQSRILESLDEYKDFLKPKTRWEWAKATYETNVAHLDPYIGDADTVLSLLRKRHQGTCSWIFEQADYLTWLGADSSQMLYLSGQSGSGKSIIGAAIYDKLRNTPDQKASIVYISFTNKDNTVADLGDDKTEKAKATLLYNLYAMLSVEHDNEQAEVLLEDANRLFQQPKKADHTRSGTVSGSEFYLPPFRQTMASLTRLLKKDLLMIVDGLDQLDKEDENEINRELEALAGLQDVKLHVLTVCQDEPSLREDSSATFLSISVEDNNQDDLSKVLDDTLAAQQGLTAQERTEAKRTVLLKAGSNFAYVSDIAVPFLKQPFRRPYSTHLGSLPEGVIDTYRQALAFLQPAYYELLQTALLWTLYAQQPIRVQEIMEAHSGLYLVDLDMGGDEDYEQYKAQKNDIAQLNEASGPFLRIYNNTLSEPIAVPKDLVHIRELCSSSNGSATHDSQHEMCHRCRTRDATQGQLTLDKDKVHVRLATRLLQHLNSPLYQKRYWLVFETNDGEQTAEEPVADNGTTEEPTADGSEGAAEQLTAQDKSGTEEASSDDVVDGASAAQDTDEVKGGDSATDAQDVPGDTKADVPSTVEVDDQTTASTEKASEENPAIEADDANNAEDDQGYITDPSEDGEDEDDAPDEWETRRQLMREDKAYTVRYELEQWPYHVREAEKQCFTGDKCTDSEWLELVNELDKFAFNTRVFQQWQNIYRDRNEEENTIWGLEPLNVAAHLGLLHWAKHLIDEKGQDPTVRSQGYRPLDSVKPNDENREILNFFLEETGKRLEANSEEGDFRAAALDRWLQADASPQTVQFFLDAGADFTAEYKPADDEWTPLHSLAKSIKDPEALKLVLNAPGHPDIMAKMRPDGDTPLHILLQNSDISTELVQAFIDAGASIDEENKQSARPLDKACWGGNLEIVKTLLNNPIKDIDDPDDDGLTALHVAAQRGEIALLEILLSHNADLERKTRRGRTAVTIAARCGLTNVVQDLIARGANIIVPDGHGRTCLFWACYENKTPEVPDVILAALKEQGHGINEINPTTKGGRTPLRMAATRGFTHIVEELINISTAAGVDVPAMLNIQDDRAQSTALHRAAAHGKVDCVRVLLEHGASATLLNADQQTALQVACEKWQVTGDSQYEEIMCLCVPHDLDRINEDADLAILAATYGSVRLLRLLVDNNVDVHRADSFGWTPLLHAQRAQMVEAETFLKSYAAWRNKLPKAWIKHNAIPETLELTEDGLSLTHTTGEVLCLTTDRPLPGNLDRFYFEIKLKPNEEVEDWPSNPEVAIGFANLNAQAFEFPGRGTNTILRNAKSWAYHGDDGWYGNTTKFIEAQSTGQRNEYICGEPFGPGDVIGAGVDLQTQEMWFTKNGVKNEFQHEGVSGRLFPIIGVRNGVMLETTFRPPFKWTDGSEMETVADAEVDEGEAETKAVDTPQQVAGADPEETAGCV